ncbi:MAG: hypothetical protein CMB80_29050 [Flammeovirgaceae bacterium]|nr:hypothetical protein [Flammeovirgaceae bacterium]MBR09295.1 hypothetical protein [Rickettsiales bacterium]HCX22024.1 hypothetical protein [Cytophagales bacterium]
MMKRNNSFRFYLNIPLLGLIGGLLSLQACSDETEDSTLRAQAILTSIHADTDSTFLIGDQSYGIVDFFQSEDSIVTIEIYLENFPPNTIHSVHMHSGPCTQPGMHWNQGFDMTTYFCTESSLGLPWAKPRAGDVGNVSVGYDGSGIFTLKTDIWKLASGNSLDIIDLSIVIHEMQDDFVGECDPSHDHTHTHANAKVACGSIELMQ